MTKERKLVAKLAKVMETVKYIEKRGFNRFHKYKYATESDVSEKVREVLAEEKVMMLPDVVEHTTREHLNQRGNKEYIATVKMKFTFIDGETGEEISIHSIGEGQDAGDKAVYKAITGATKYALMKAFMIPTGDDPEQDYEADERNSTQQNNQQAPPQQNNQQVQQNQPVIGKAILLAKFKQGGKTEEEFNAWYADQLSKGYNNNQIDQILTQALMKKANEQ